MVKCQSCGAENSPGRARCEYCDAALAATRHLDVQWSARSRDGTAGRGRLVVVAGGSDATGERARGAVEAAFAAAVDAGAKADQVEAAMRERLAGLLPPGWTIESFQVEAVSAPAAHPGPGQVRPAAASGGAGCKLPLFALLFLLALGSSCCALGGFLAGSDASARAARVRVARVVEPVQAGDTGYVCLEAQTARVSSPLVLGDLRALLIETRSAELRTVTRRDSKGVTTTRKERGPERTTTERVASFQLGGLDVAVSKDTRFSPLTPLQEEEEDELGGRVRRSVFKADQPLTVVGMVRSGTLLATEVTTYPTRIQFLEKLEGEARTDRVMAVVFVVMTALFLLAGVAALLKRGRST